MQALNKDGTSKLTVTYAETRWDGEFDQVKTNNELREPLTILFSGALQEQADSLTQAENECSGEEGGNGTSDSDEGGEAQHAASASSNEAPPQHGELDPVAEGLGDPACVLLTQAEWKNSREMEAVLQPVAELSHMIQASNYTTSNIGLPLLTVLRDRLTADTVDVKSASKTSHTVSLPASSLGELSSTMREVLVEQMNKRFFHKPLSVTKLLALKLDPTLDEDAVLSGFPQSHRMAEVYDEEYDEAAAFLEASRRPPSLRNSPTKSTPKPSSSGSTLKAGMSNFARKSPASGGAASAVASEKLRFATISEEDVRKGMVSREGGEEEFDILEMWSRLEKDFPVHYIIARSALSACETEAHEERVFSFMKHVLGDLRQSMDCEMLEMWVELGFDLKYEEVCPTVEQVLAEYEKQHGVATMQTMDEVGEQLIMVGGDDEEEEGVEQRPSSSRGEPHACSHV